MKAFILFFGVSIGAVVGVLATPYLAQQEAFSSLLSGISPASDSQNSEPAPLYWVAPMDPNYRRDKPGKSPMGMDLIPVYDEQGQGESSPGTITISPEVINNLGVRSGVVEKRKLESNIETVGYIQYNEDTLIHIHPRIAGWVEKLYVTAEGDPVKQGQPLYDIYSPELINAQEELLLALSQKSDRLKRGAIRKLRLLYVPETSIQRLLRTRKVAEHITFYAPQSGVLDNLSIREGFFVKPETTMMSIGSLDEVWVEAEVFEKQAGLVKLGAHVNMRLDYFPGKQWQGQVDYIYPSLDEMTRTLKVRIRFSNEDKLLKPNMFANVQIHSSEALNLLMIPREAVIRTENQDRVVLALDEGKFKSVAVKLGQADDTHIQVLDGVLEGERVVTSAQFLLDSESSKTSDFLRMEARSEQGSIMEGMSESTWVEVKVESIEQEEDIVLMGVTHKPIDDWEQPEMTMYFLLSPTIDASSLAVGMILHVEITKRPDDVFEIVSVHIPDQAEYKNTEEIDHEGHDMTSDMAEGLVDTLKDGDQ